VRTAVLARLSSLPARALSPGLLPAAAAGLAFGMAAVSLLRRAEALDLPAYDNAFFEQVVWNLGHGRGFSGTFFPADFLGLHFSPLLALPALLELAWPGGELLILLHSLALAATAPAAFLFLRALAGDRPNGGWAAAALAAPVPFWAEIQQAARAGFHTEALALPALLLAGWAGLRNRPLLCSALALLALTAREDQAFGVAVIGALLFFHGPSRRLGAGLLAAAAGWGLAVELLVMPALRGGIVSQVDSYYRWLQTASPAEAGAALLNGRGWLAFAGMVASAGGLALLRLRWLALALPPLLADLLSAHHPQPELLFQYGLPLVLPILVAAGLGIRRFLDRRPPPWTVAALAVPALLIGLLSGPLPAAQSGASSGRERLFSCTAGMPSAAPAAVDDPAALPLAARPVLKLITETSPQDFVVVDRTGRVPSYVDRGRREAVVARLPDQNRRLLCDDGRFQLWGPVGV
jgi:uncharacterized membrane protein